MLHCHEWLNVYYSVNMFRWKPILSKMFYVVFNQMCEVSNEHHTITRKLIWNMTKQFPEHICTKIKPNWAMFKWKTCHNYLILCSKVHLCLPECLVATRRGVSNTLTTAEIMEQRVSFLVMMDSKSCGGNPFIFRQKQCAIMLCEYAIPHTAMQTWTNVIVQSYWTTVFGAHVCVKGFGHYH